MFTNLDKQKYSKYYISKLNEYGLLDTKSIGWNDFYTQNIRFKVFVDQLDFGGKKVLDIGCGLGDFYFYLQNNYEQFHYVGIDILSEMIVGARKKYLGVEFYQNEIHEVTDLFFDYIVGSGVFSMNIKDYEEKYMKMIKLCFQKCKKGFAFNMLKKGMHPDDADHVTYHPNEILSYCKGLTNNVKLIVGYLDYDFTIVMKKS